MWSVLQFEKYFHSVKSMSRSASDPTFGTNLSAKSWHQITAEWGGFPKNLVRKFALVDLRS